MEGGTLQSIDMTAETDIGNDNEVGEDDIDEEPAAGLRSFPEECSVLESDFMFV